MSRLKGIQSSPKYPESTFLHELEKSLQLDLEHLLKKEEIKWFQKAWTEWVTKGNRNTRFNYLKTKMRA